jgi:hypothetical protein
MLVGLPRIAGPSTADRQKNDKLAKSRSADRLVEKKEPEGKTPK